MYAGLTPADKPALERAKENGNICAWKTSGGYMNSSSKYPSWDVGGKVMTIDTALAQIAEMESKPIDESATDDIVLAEVYSLREKLKIAADIIHKLDPNYDVTEFLHQVGSADYDQREEDLAPLTWNERINQMTVSEKADWMKDNDFCIVMKLPENGCFEFNSCTECLETWLNSPYTEGVTK